MSIPKIFLSYSWANSKVADDIDNYFLLYGVSLIRDLRALEYRDDLKEYMGRIQETDYVIMLIGNDFLTSENCMYEMLKMISVKDFEERILPVNIGDAKFYTPTQRAYYYKLWDDKIALSKQQAIEYETTDFAQQLKHQRDIRNSLPEFFTKIASLNLQTHEELKAAGYRPIFKILGFENGVFLAKLDIIIDMEDKDMQLTALEELSSEFGPNFLINFQKAVIYKREEKFSLSKLFFEKAISNKPAFPNLYNDFALLLENQFQDFDRAKGLYVLALTIDPMHQAAKLNLTNLIENQYKDIQQARILWERAIKDHPENIKYKNNLAALLSEQYNDYELALTYYQNALALKPDYFNALIGMAGLLNNNLNRKVEAVDYFQRALAIRPDDSTFCVLIDLLVELKDVDKLNEVMETAQIETPTEKLYLKCARTKGFLLKKFEAAKECYLKAIKLNGKSASAYNHYAAFLEYQIKDIELARYNYEKAIELAPQNAMYHYNYAYLVDRHFNLFELSKKHYLLAMEYDPSEYNILLNLGELLIRYNHEDEAIPYLQKAKEIDSCNKLTYINLANYYAKANNLDKQAEMYEIILQLDPDDFVIKWKYAEVLAQQENIPEARLQYQAAIPSSNYDQKTYMSYIGFLISQNDLESARQLCQVYIAQKPEDISGYINYSTVLMRLKMFDEPLRILEKLLLQNDKDPIVHYNLAMLYQQTGKEDLYIKHMKLAEQYGFHEKYMIRIIGGNLQP